MGGFRQLARGCSGCRGMRRVVDSWASAGDRAVIMLLRTRCMALGVCVALLLTFAACGYHTSGHAVRLPDNIHTVYIPMFENATQTFRVEQTITAAVVQEFRSRTSYRIVTSD